LEEDRRVNILITGAGGFVGHHTVEHLLANTDHHLILVDSFRHRGKYDRLREVFAPLPPSQRARIATVVHDLRAPFTAQTVDTLGPINVILNIASESHVDRSLSDPVPFVKNNIDVALNMLELARTLPDLSLFVQVSTDEVYGPVPRGRASAEWDPIIPSNPYAASKAAQEAIAVSYWRSYGVPVIITNTMNIIGERQDPEKFLPMVIRNITRGDPIPVHAAPDGTPGSRVYLHARNQADALLWLIGKGTPTVYDRHNNMPQRPDRHNIAGESESTNLQIVEKVAAILGREPFIDLVDFHSTRPGHDLRYALDSATTRAAGWKPPIPFDESLRRTVEWTVQHPQWMEG